MSKFSNLKENMHRFKTKNLTEQEVQQPAKVSPAIQDFLDKNIPAGMVFTRGVSENDRLKDLAIGYTEMPTEFNELWNSSLKQYRNDKNQQAFTDLMTILKKPQVIVKPRYGGSLPGGSPYMYKVVGSTSLRLVEV
jgi:hypothetical protein